ncbi:helix-turn-helix domain-containing protein [Methylobacterium soli]|uniref:Helix-turn-helix domain-containing protein n=1 Tax=Methylobacterium soli TaxID=553447 RepID=A0A6L3SRX9_9HYPH|nr:helix-turn-helix domain-containing protein [Methylobacterium soli]KAB1075910.1 helix-turn-helix domain-containing protein [Methylobacterium soli]
MAEAHVQDDQRQALQDELSACLARAASIAAELIGGPETSSPEPDAEWPKFADDPDLITPDYAAKRAGVDASTIRKWCQAYGIGKMYGCRRWRVSVKRLQAYLAR